MVKDMYEDAVAEATRAARKLNRLSWASLALGVTMVTTGVWAGYALNADWGMLVSGPGGWFVGGFFIFQFFAWQSRKTARECQRSADEYRHRGYGLYW